MGPREAKKAKRRKRGFLPFCPLRLSCRRRLSSSSMRAPTVSSTQRRRSSPSPVLRPIEAEGAHCLYRESRFVPPLFVYVFPAHEVCQSWTASLLFEMQPYGISTAPLISFSRAVKQVSSNRLIRPQNLSHFFIPALTCPLAIGAPIFLTTFGLTMIR